MADIEANMRGEVVDAADNACSFHIYSLLLNVTNYDAIICKRGRIIL